MTILRPFKDETIFSFIQRVVVMDAAATEKKAAKRLFNSSSLQFFSPFPSFIPRLAELSDFSANEWIDQHTVLPAYRAFTPIQKYEEAYRNLENGEGEKVFKALSLIANRQCQTGRLNYCPQCAIDDSSIIGIAHWHVCHQFPGAYQCKHHRCRLVTVAVSRHRFDSWPSLSVKSTLRATTIEERLTRFTEFFHSRGQSFVASLQDVYLQRLAEKGFLTRHSHIRLRSLRQCMLSTYEQLLHHSEISSIFDCSRVPHYPTCVIRKQASVLSPLKHLLLLAFLFKSPEELLNFISGQRNEKKAVEAKTINSNEVDDTESIVSLLTEGESLRRTSQAIGRSVAYIKKLAIKEGLGFESRAQRLFSTERRLIAFLLLAGYPTDVIARKFECSKGAIEQVLSQHPDIVQLRKLRRYFDKRQEMRSSLLATKDCLQKPRRQDIKKMNNKAYMWLFKNDKDWLYNHLPSATPRSQRRIR
ncbi:TnsD family Tn7-like transposition protein [Alteromonas macleodii]|uniref:TnsD family Tn7-like transposition protein n=1 Tax=Alteromonas macleodii TaxID=28108 RepID=UPI00364E77E3